MVLLDLESPAGVFTQFILSQGMEEVHEGILLFWIQGEQSFLLLVEGQGLTLFMIQKGSNHKLLQLIHVQ